MIEIKSTSYLNIHLPSKDGFNNIVLKQMTNFSFFKT